MKSKKKLEKTGSGVPQNADAIFPLIFASLLRASNSASAATISKKKKLGTKTNCSHQPNSYHQLQLQLLTQLHHCLLSQIPTHNCSIVLPVPILSLLPLLLKSKCAEVVSKCVEFVGAASLYTLEMNEQIANDEETVKSLISALRFSNRRRRRSTIIAACNAVLDMSTTSIGRGRLLDCSVLQFIIISFLQAPKSSAASVSLFTGEKGTAATPRIGFKEDELSALLLDAAVTLVAACTSEQLEKIPRKLSETFLAYLKKLWAILRGQILSGNILKYSQQSQFYLSNIRANNLAECTFRLAMNADLVTTPPHVDIVQKSIFSWEGYYFEQFILNHWEVSPLFMQRFSKPLDEEGNIFSSFKQSLNLDGVFPYFLSMILKNLISCPPIASDELDILGFLKEVKSHLGCPMIYQQDIRVLKTQHLEQEVHFFHEHPGSRCFQDPKYLNIDDILRCEEAYRKGYTIALRGMEFRFGSIAAIVDGLASLFGQPSAGVNLYLTPPNSQGLAFHYDDHCVLVYQLVGVKQWTVFPRSSLQLPRLYEPIGSLHEPDTSTEEGCEHFLLREGDILYIPRGSPHKACTILDEDRLEENAEFSLHLTLAIEVEPPFEWEGFTHVALHIWFQKERQLDYTCNDSLSWYLNAVSVNLMHVAINLISDTDPIFRKACLAGAVSLSQGGTSRLDLNQRTIFSQLIERVNTKSVFSDVFGNVASYLDENEDPWRRLRWLQNLDDEEETIEVQKWKIPWIDSERLVIFCNQHKEQAEVTFMQAKSKFCSEVVFDEVKESYEKLLEKYRKVRKQYMSGMLSLQCSI